MKKYKILTDRSDTLYDGTKVYQIQALRDFGNVRKGDIGGWVESESNLSQDGDCWVYKGFYVTGNNKLSNDNEKENINEMKNTNCRIISYVNQLMLKNKLN